MNNCCLASSIKLSVPEIDQEIQQIADMLLAIIDMRDKTTGQHSRNVAIYSLTIGSAFGLAAPDLKSLYLAGIFHDVGKFGIPENILLKSDKLTQEELDLIRTHAKKSADIVKTIQPIKELAYIIECHHERYDGSGYPSGLKGEQIPLLARILAVADAFDAMTTERCYKKSLPLEEAVQELRNLAFIQFDPAIVEIYINWLTDNGFLRGKYTPSNNTAQIETNGLPSCGLAWVKGGKILVKDPKPGLPKATITPCRGVSLYINNVLVEKETEITSKDNIRLIPLFQKEPGFVRVHISKDRLHAYLEMRTDILVSYKLQEAEPSNRLTLSTMEIMTKQSPLGFDAIIKLLEKHQVIYGIDYNVIKELVEYPYDGMVEVAQGQLPTPPIDGKIELLFEETRESFELFDENASIDFKEINRLPTVGVGDPLAINHPPEPGTPGKDVSGSVLKAKEPISFNLKAGKGVKILEDGTKAISLIEGLPKVKKVGTNWTILVESLLVHNGDVNMSTGNIRFRGNVHIAGSVDSGMSISASGDVLVSGLVTGAKVTAGANLFIKGNVVNGELFAGGFFVLAETIKPLLGQLKLYLIEVYEFAAASYSRIASSKTIRMGNILAFMRERNFHRQLTYVEVLQNKLKEFDLKILGSYEETLVNSLNKLSGINLINFVTPEEFYSTIAQIQTVYEYMESTSTQQGTVKITCALNSFIRSARSVFVHGPGCFNTQIFSGGSVTVKGVFCGGTIQAAEHAHIYEAGSEMGIKTTIAVAADKRIKFDRVYPGVYIQIGKQRKIIDNKVTRVEYYLDEEQEFRERSF